MKRIIPLLLMATLLIGCSGNNEKVVEAKKVEKSGKIEAQETQEIEQAGTAETVETTVEKPENMDRAVVRGSDPNVSVDRAVFTWEGVDEEGLNVIQKYGINTILLDYNYTSDISSLALYNTFVLAGSPEWGADEMSKVIGEAEALGADGVVFDIESDYAALADNLEKLEKLNTDFPVYVCIPFWLDDLEKENELVGTESGKEIVERIIKSTDGVFIMNYYKGGERQQAEFELELAKENEKKIWTIYELQPPGVYDLKEYNTYYSDGIKAVEDNYKEQFSGTDAGIAFHNLEMMKELR